MSRFLWFRNLFAVYLGASNSVSREDPLSVFSRFWFYLKAVWREDLLLSSFGIIGKIQFFMGCWPEVTLTFLPHGPTHREAQNIAAGFSQQMDDQG